MTPRYASETSVSVDRSRSEIEKLLAREGATAFAAGWDANAATLMFDLHGRRIRLTLPMPDPADREFTRTATGKIRTATAAREAFEQGQRQRWRALGLVIKAKLEAVKAGISTLETEFLNWIVIPGTGETVGDRVVPELTKAYSAVGYAPMLELGR